jgi:hypothetical protein
MDVGRKPKSPQNPDSIPVEVDFVPRQAMPRRSRVGMVVVVPDLAKRQQRHPPTISRQIPRRKAARTPNMRGRIDQPGRMKSHNDSQKNSPQ